MADISQIKLPNNTVLNLKDSKFRNWSVGSDTVDFLTVKSCTPNSQKTFKLYIDDDGALIVRKGSNWFDVDYYDGDELLHTEEIWTSGTNATWNGTPSKECDDEAYEYVFLGWATNMNAEAANPNAQTNITSDRLLYAVYKKEKKKFTVKFYSDSNTVLETVEGVEYGTSLYEILNGKSWVENVIWIGNDSTDIYSGSESTSIVESQSCLEDLADTQIIDNTYFDLTMKSESGG